MSKNTGPYFEFMMNKDGARVEFVFLPGNVSKKVFEDTAVALTSAFDNQYGISSKDYIRQVNLEDGTPSIAIYQSKILPVLKVILGGRAFSDFKLKITGIDKDGNEKTKIINNPVEAKEAAEVIPYFNKRNNDMTTRRSK
jgi:hypothetical protein